MKTAGAAARGRATHGSRIVLADGRELIDGIASWWTACHGYNHPHIRAAVERQLARMPHVMFGGLVHEPALTLAAGSPRCCRATSTACSSAIPARSRSRSRMKMAVQYWLNAACAAARDSSPSRGGYHGDTTGAMAVSDPDEGMHAAFRRLLPEQIIVDLPVDEASDSGARSIAGARTAKRSRRSSSSRWCRAPAACAFTTPDGAARLCAHSPTVTSCC